MTTAAGYFDRKPSSNFRPGLSHLQQNPSSPRTPQRTFSSAFSSPSISYRTEEEALVFDFGTRHLSAGFAGETTPRCTLSFGPEESRRVGDYRRWLPNYKKVIRRQSASDWGRDHELWRMDLREVNLGLVEDKIERAVREACNKYLLLDVKSRRLLLVLPSVLPHELLSSILSTIFVNFQHPTITLFSTAIVHAAAAGCRSGLVVDVGWSETTVTAIYEYREVQQSRTTRAMKRVTLDMVKMLQTYSSPSGPEPENAKDETIEADFDIAEDITTRMAWCHPTREDSLRTAPHQPDLTDQLLNISIAEDAPLEDPINIIPSPFHPPQKLSIPFSAFALPVESALLASSLPRHAHDTEEQPIPSLIFTALLRLPPDVRAVCMSHIIITGGGSNIPGLKSRILAEISASVKERGWDPVQGKAAEETRRKLREISQNRSIRGSPSDNKPSEKRDKRPPAQGLGKLDKSGEERQAEQEEDGDEYTTPPNPDSPPPPKAAAPPLPASQQPQLPDPIEDKLRQAQLKGSKPIASGVVRGVESLGAWAGGSLLPTLRVRGAVEVDRDVFLAHGLAGARKGGEGGRGGGGGWAGGQGGGGGAEREKGGWNLGGWGRE